MNRLFAQLFCLVFLVQELKTVIESPGIYINRQKVGLTSSDADMIEIIYEVLSKKYLYKMLLLPHENAYLTIFATHLSVFSH